MSFATWSIAWISTSAATDGGTLFAISASIEMSMLKGNSEVCLCPNAAPGLQNSWNTRASPDALDESSDLNFFLLALRLFSCLKLTTPAWARAPEFALIPKSERRRCQKFEAIVFPSKIWLPLNMQLQFQLEFYRTPLWLAFWLSNFLSEANRLTLCNHPTIQLV